MWWFEAAIRIEPGIVEHNVELAVAQCAPRRVEIELSDAISDTVYRLAVFRVELQCVVSELVWCSFDLLENVAFGEEVNTAFHSEICATRDERK